MDREKISVLLSQYEDHHRVEDYAISECHLWPLLRLMACWTLYEQRESVGGGSFGAERRMRFHNKAVRGFDALAMLARGVRGARRAGGKSRQSTPTSDVIVLTSGNRIQRLGAEFHNYVSDPFVEALANHGISCGVWQLDAGGRPSQNLPPRLIRRELAKESRIDPFEVYSLWRRGAPAWFGEFADWWRTTTGKTLSWGSLLYRLQEIVAWSRTFECWLEAARCKVLVVDCWYGYHAIAAILAASRLGLASMDLQHGLQGEGHFAYSGWHRAPPLGYPAMPSHYWVWGLDDAEHLCASNPGIIGKTNVLVGGNLWVNKWKDHPTAEMSAAIEDVRRLVAGYKRCILVTLQKGVEYHDAMVAAFRDSPADWLWLIRVHRGDMHRLVEIEQDLSGFGGSARFFVREATAAPLYAIFRVCDCHMTWYSTCAMEALSFGVPSVILHPSGTVAYRKHLDRGAMVSCSNHEDVITAVQSCMGIDRAHCLQQAEHAFVSSTASEGAVQEFIGRLLHSEGRHVALHSADRFCLRRESSVNSVRKVSP